MSHDPTSHVHHNPPILRVRSTKIRKESSGKQRRPSASSSAAPSSSSSSSSAQYSPPPAEPPSPPNPLRLLISCYVTVGIPFTFILTHKSLLTEPGKLQLAALAMLRTLFSFAGSQEDTSSKREYVRAVALGNVGVLYCCRMIVHMLLFTDICH
jgi:hypothetical protein